MEQEPVPKAQMRPNKTRGEQQYSMSLIVHCATKCRGLVRVNFFCGALVI